MPTPGFRRGGGNCTVRHRGRFPDPTEPRAARPAPQGARCPRSRPAPQSFGSSVLLLLQQHPGRGGPRASVRPVAGVSVQFCGRRTVAGPCMACGARPPRPRRCSGSLSACLLRLVTRLFQNPSGDAWCQSLGQGPCCVFKCSPCPDAEASVSSSQLRTRAPGRDPLCGCVWHGGRSGSRTRVR